MKIKADHRLYHDDDTPYAFVPSPNFYDAVSFDFLVWHYTANNNSQSAINVLTEKKVPDDHGVSAHLVIDKDGTITQLVPFNRGAWHAGASHWEGRRWINRHSIGIEIVNDGKLKSGEGSSRYVASSGREYDEPDFVIATHENEFFEAGWPRYPQAQLDATLEVSKLLVEHYGLKDALGHEDIADARIGKVDPGPAFPKAEFRERLFERREPEIVRYELTKTVDVLEDTGRTPAYKLPPLHTASPFPAKAGLKVKKIDRGWAQVKLQNEPDAWVAVNDLDRSNPKKVVTRVRTQAFAFQPDPQPALHNIKSLPKGFPVRVLREEKDYVLVANLKGVAGYKVVHGWVPQGALKRVE